MTDGYVPRILLCGDLNSFAAAATDMKFELVGEISFTGAAERGENFLFASDADCETYQPKDFRIFLNGEEISISALRKILNGTADYIVFDNSVEFIGRYNELYALKILEQSITRETLFRQARRNFYSYTNFPTLVNLFREKNFSRLFDLDGFFAESGFDMLPDFFPTTDTLGKALSADSRKNFVDENFYRRIYASLDECRFKFYDAILIGERSPENFIDAIISTDGLSENVLTFARKNSVLESWLVVNKNVFEKISVSPATNGNWYLLKKRVPPKTFCIYVVTHKDVKLSTLPDGYKIIHAGHALATEDFGYLGDDTGDNISKLNRYLNEATALYWMWKNSSDYFIGLNHYRRFFTTKKNAVRKPTESANMKFHPEDILSKDAALKILEDFDIIVADNVLARVSVSCWQMFLSGDDLEKFVERIFKKHLADKQPNYLDAFDKVANSFTSFQYEVFVTRRPIFDAYCEWLFSFLTDVTNEVFARTNIEQIDNPRKYRILSFFTERMLNVWLTKNPLKIKRLPVMFRRDV